MNENSELWTQHAEDLSDEFFSWPKPINQPNKHTMSKQKNKEIIIEIPQKALFMCNLLQITPQEILLRYLHDLCGDSASGGSDEREMSKAYFLRACTSSEQFTRADFIFSNIDNIGDDLSNSEYLTENL